MSKKPLIIILSVIGILLIAGGVTLALSLAKGAQSNTSTVVADKPICTLVTRESIATALAVDSGMIGTAIDQGEVNDQNGKTRTCFYQLGTKSNSLYSNVTITATTFSNYDVQNNTMSGFAVVTKPKTVDGLTTYFSSLKSEAVTGAAPASTVPAQSSYKLFVFKASKMYTYGLVNPTNKDVFKDKAAAEKALSTLVRSADL